MNFGFVASLIVIIIAVLSVFIEIPVVSNYAFWFAVGAYIMLAGTASENENPNGPEANIAKGRRGGPLRYVRCSL